MTTCPVTAVAWSAGTGCPVRYASLSMPLKGSRGEGRLRAKLEKISGVWQPYFACIQIGNKSLVLLEGRGKYSWWQRLF